MARGHAAPLAWAPAIGPITSVGRGSLLVRLGALTLLLAAALTVRATDRPHHRSTLPALPSAAVVVPGVARAAQPKESDMPKLRYDQGVRAVVAVNGEDSAILSNAEEQAVAQSLGLRYLRLQIAEGAAPSPAQLSTLVDLLRTVRPSRRTAQNRVLLHDQTGHGPVVVLSAMVQLLYGQPLTSVAAAAQQSTSLSSAQSIALRQLSDAIHGTGALGNPYVTLKGSNLHE